MANDTQQTIDTLIAHIRSAEAEGSITNVDVARIFEFLNTKFPADLNAQASRISTLELDTVTARNRIDGIIAKTPTGGTSYAMLNSSGELMAQMVPDYLARTYQVADTAIYALFEYSVASKYRYTSADPLDDDTTFYANGDARGDYRFAFGEWLTPAQIREALASRWIPGVPGILPDAVVNIPAQTSGLTTSLTFDFLATGSTVPRVIVLGKRGFNSISRPVSARRAFHGCSRLRQVVGVIDCRQFADSNALLNAFAGCSGLQTVLLSNIPDCITSIDFSDCPDILQSCLYMTNPDTGATTRTDTLLYLANNRSGRDDSGNLIRTTPLTVYVHPSVYNALASGDYIEDDSGEPYPEGSPYRNTAYNGTGGTRIIYSTK